MSVIDRIVKNVERRRGELSVDKLSKLCDIPASTIIKILRKEVKDVRISTLEALAKGLSCSVDDLLK
ncbi:MAG: XRE family transcriptional regulator [Candidatus Margulisbacteria bacterium]|nr:XRE family transcriptional regulator [Candidatus Margulisiibacteriota bacterium]